MKRADFQFSQLKNKVRLVATVALNALLIVLLPVLFLFRILLRRQPKYQRRSIWTGAPIITMPLNAAVEGRLGFDSKTIVRSTYFITDSFDLNIFAKAQKNRFFAFLLTYLVFAWICLTADRVHAYVDGGLLVSRRRFCFSRLELFFYHRLKIKLFVWTYGGDVRNRQTTLGLGKPNCCTDCSTILSSCICTHEEAALNYQRVASVATAVFSMGDMIEYTPKSHNDLFFWPVDLNRDNGRCYQPSYPQPSKSKPLRVVHAANHRQFKGTKYLEAAITQLIAEGISIELILVERIRNDEALAIYRSADLVFDQCLIGFHGYFAIEAMALGKPVMCFIRNPETYLLAPEHCPILNVHRDHLQSALRRFATCERDLLPDIGRQSRAYVEKYYTMDAFAQRLKNCYETLGVAV